MKKLILVCTMVCASQLYGMDKEKPKSIEFGEEWKRLPDEITAQIMMVLAQRDDNLDEVINNIKKVSLINKAFNQMINEVYGVDNLQMFTKLVHMLADKFNVNTSEVAQKFKSPIAHKYWILGIQLTLNASKTNTFTLIKDLIDQGADVNFTTSSSEKETVTPLYNAIEHAFYPQSTIETIKLLLASGAKPTSLELMAKKLDRFPKDIQQMIKNAVLSNQ